MRWWRRALTCGQRLIALALPLALALVAETVLLQLGFTRRGRVAPSGIDSAACVARGEDGVEVLTVGRAGRVDLILADELVPLVHVDRQLVADLTLAVLLRPSGVANRLAPLRWLPVGGIARCSISAFSRGGPDAVGARVPR